MAVSRLDLLCHLFVQQLNNMSSSSTIEKIIALLGATYTGNLESWASYSLFQRHVYSHDTESQPNSWATLVIPAVIQWLLITLQTDFKSFHPPL
jgi:hypothetical protein